MEPLKNILKCPVPTLMAPPIGIDGDVPVTPAAPIAVWPEALPLQGVALAHGIIVVKGGPEVADSAEPLGPEVVVELELEEQLPELPLTPV
jgi:hypothetical protein